MVDLGSEPWSPPNSSKHYVPQQGQFEGVGFGDVLEGNPVVHNPAGRGVEDAGLPQWLVAVRLTEVELGGEPRPYAPDRPARYRLVELLVSHLADGLAAATLRPQSGVAISRGGAILADGHVGHPRWWCPRRDPAEHLGHQPPSARHDAVLARLLVDQTAIPVRHPQGEKPAHPLLLVHRYSFLLLQAETSVEGRYVPHTADDEDVAHVMSLRLPVEAAESRSEERRV